MIIDTNGFEIGDEVWIPNLFNYPCDPIKLKITEFKIKNSMIYVCFSDSCIENTNVHTSYLYHSKSDCQLACDRLNGVSHD